MTIPDGLTVRFTHERMAVVNYLGQTKPMTYWQARENEAELHPRGGRTIARLFNEHDELVAQGVACCGKRDNFNKRLGRCISLGRALDGLSVADNTREGHV